MSKFTDAVERGLEGLHAVSMGTCGGCAERPETDEARFSWSACGICGSKLGGDRHAWHALDSDNALLHFDDACTDCLIYIANGEEPNSD